MKTDRYPRCCRILLPSVLTLLAVCVLPISAAAQNESTSPSGGEPPTKVGTSGAQFLKLGMGARPIGLGGSFVAQANDLSALYWNAAGLTNLNGSAVQLSYSDYLLDVAYSNAAFGTNLGSYGTLAASIFFLDSGEMQERTVDQPGGTGARFAVQNLSLQVSYAKALTDRFSIGGSVKYVRESIMNSSASAVAVDIGTLFTTPYERLRLGASFSNFGPKLQMSGRDLTQSIDPTPDQSGNNEIVNVESQTDPVSLPLLFRVGLAWDAVNQASHRVTLSTDAAHPNDNTEFLNFGAEYSFRDLVMLRGGLRNWGEEDGEETYTLGAGLNLRIARSLRSRFDYAYAAFGRLDATHWFTFDLAF
jgi:hypothetical protein